MPGLLIVNADDFGGNSLATDRILECFASRRITSTTAMVYMHDSKRAAEIACSRELPVGLHLNLTQPFEDPETPVGVRERQARAVKYFADARRRRFTYNPRMRALAEACAADQLSRFRELFGVAPTHIDGHNHVHLSPTALFSLPAAVPVRTGESVSGRASLGSLMRMVRHRAIARGHRTTDYFFAIDRLGKSPSGQDIKRLLALADRASVEIMVHPDRNSDFHLLMSDAWADALPRESLGSFRELEAA